MELKTFTAMFSDRNTLNFTKLQKRTEPDIYKFQKNKAHIAI